MKKVFGNLYFQGFFLFLAYLATAYIGLKLDAVGGFATLVWAPSGISLAFLVVFGSRLWPAIFLSAFFINLYFGANFLAAVGMGIGNTLEALAAVFLLKKYRFNFALGSLSDVLKLVVFGALLATLISATVGSLSLYLTGQINSNLFQPTWIAWWVGDVLGNLVVAPLLITWMGKPKFIMEKIRFNELCLWLVFTIFLALVVLGNVFNGGVRNSPFSYFVFPPLIWGALRFSQPTIMLVTLVVSVISIWFTTIGTGPFARTDLSESLLFLQLFISVLSITILIMSGVVKQLRDSEEQVIKLNKALAENIRKETDLNRLLATKISKKNKLDIK